MLSPGLQQSKDVLEFHNLAEIYPDVFKCHTGMEVSKAVQMAYGSHANQTDLCIRRINEVYLQYLYGISKVYLGPDGKTYHIIPGHFLYYRELPDKTFIVDLDKIHKNYGPTQRPENVIYIIGAEPSFSEYENQANFVGDFGNYLLNSLYNQGLLEYPIYLANAIRVYKTPKSLRQVFVKDFEPLVWEELSLLRPRAIICLGSLALKLFTVKSQKIVSETPLTYQYKTISNGKVETVTAQLYTLPLTALHSQSEHQNFTIAVRRIAKFIKGEKSDREDFTYDVIRSTSELRNLIIDIAEKSKRGVVHVAVDCEWHGRFPGDKDSYVRTINIAYGPDPIKVAVIVLTKEGGDWVFDGRREEVAAYLQPLFSREIEKIQIVGHNFISDIPWLESLGINVRQKFWFPEDLEYDNKDYNGVFDTIIAYHAVDECGKFGLEDAARIWMDFPAWSQDLESWLKSKSNKAQAEKGYGYVPEEILLPYAAKDAYVTLKLSYILKERLDRDFYGNKCWKPYWMNLRSQPAFLEIYETGILVDKGKYNQLCELYNSEKEKLVREFREEIRWPDFNFQSYNHCVELLYGEQYHGRGRIAPPDAICFNLVPVKTTDGLEWNEQCLIGRVSPSTDLDSLTFLASQDKRIEKLVNIKKLNQVTKTWLVVSEDDSAEGLLKFVCWDGRIHPHYVSLKETRRCSSSNPNIQNLPNVEEETYKRILGDRYIAPIRSIFVAPPGYKMIEVDYSGAELLMIAVAARDENLISDYYRSALPDGHPDKIDIHSAIAVKAFGLNCPPTKDGLKQIGKLHLRLAAKRIIFGLNYGRGAKSCHLQLVTEGMDVTLQDVNTLIDTIYEKYDKIFGFQEAVKKRVHNEKWLANCFGSYRRFFEARSSEIVAKMEREAINFVCQSGVADAVAIAMHNFMVYPGKEEIGYRLIMHNHDALVFYVPEKHVEQFTNEVTPYCMKEKVKFKSCDLNGKPINDREFSFELEVKNV